MGNKARATGIRLWVQTQKSTTDAVPSALRHNLSTLISYRMPTNQAAATLFGGIDDFPADIRALRRGQFIYRHGTTSDMYAVQSAFVTPEDVARYAR